MADSDDLKRLERIRRSEFLDWLLVELDATKYIEEPAVRPLLDELIALLQPAKEGP